MTTKKQDNKSLIVPTAQEQSDVPYDKLLTSTNSGLTVHRQGIAKAEFRSEARIFARELADYINTTKQGIASAFVYEETFGTKDVIHWLLHIENLQAYTTMVRMGNSDPGFRDLFFKQRISDEKGGGTWDKIFLDGSITETVLMPQFMGMYGTAIEQAHCHEAATTSGLLMPPPASSQTNIPEAAALNSATAGIVLHRTAQLKYEYRGEGRMFARAVADVINETLEGEASAFLYEEAFGVSDRIHWLIHMKDLTTYYRLIAMHANPSEKVKALYTKDWISEEKGGGDWSEMFINTTMCDMALTPQHWNMYATNAKK